MVSVRWRLYLLLFIQVVSTIWNAEGVNLSFGEPCNRTEDCSAGERLICSDHHYPRECGCEYYQYYDKERKSCVVYATAPCHLNSSDLCPAEASCKPGFKLYHHDIPEALHTILKTDQEIHHVADGSCTCKNGFGTLNIKYCSPVLEYGEACSEKLEKKNVTCNPSRGLVCGEDNTCICNSTESDYYDTKSHECLPRVGRKCLGNGWRTYCQPNAMCKEMVREIEYNIIRHQHMTGRKTSPIQRRNLDGAETESYCVCLPGYTQNRKGNCIGSYGITCKSDDDCNTDHDLSCVNGACRCKYGAGAAFFESGNSSCYLLSGSACTKRKSKCVENALCEDGHCTCDDGFRETPDGKCRKLINPGEKCGSSVGNVTCNQFQGMACIRTKCGCFDSSLKWNTKTKLCEANEFGRCGRIDLAVVAGDKSGNPMYPEMSTNTHKELPQMAFFVACEKGLICVGNNENGSHGRRICKSKN